jgi:hypothetical protein
LTQPSIRQQIGQDTPIECNKNTHIAKKIFYFPFVLLKIMGLKDESHWHADCSYSWGYVWNDGFRIRNGAVNSLFEVAVMRAVFAIFAMFFLIPAGQVLSFQENSVRPPWDQRGQKNSGPPGDRRGLSDKDKQDRIDFLAKSINWQTSQANESTEMQFLLAHASDLLERAKQARGNSFQFESLTGATINLLGAARSVSSARKANQMDENDKRDAALFLQKCYFRVQQADFFSSLSSEKDSKVYVTQIRSLYQQARSAYDAKQYDRARLFGDAASMIVTALENIAHSTIHVPDPPVIK